jgi:hypothetical protein
MEEILYKKSRKEMMDEENPVKTWEAREELRIGSTRMSAIKNKLGITGRFVFLSQIRKFLRDNPNFSETEVYPKKPRRNRNQDLSGATAGTSGAR